MPRFAGGVLGPVPGADKGLRVDIKPSAFDTLIEEKGYRLAWSRACRCPCTSVNDQTEQCDPNCTLCRGIGFFTFRPEISVTDPFKTGKLDALQSRILADNNASLVRGIMSSHQTSTKPWDPVGPRAEGTGSVTVRHQNKLGYWDRLVHLDSTVSYSQRVKLEDGGRVPLRYLARQVNLMRTPAAVLVEGTDFQVVAGDVTWLPNKAPAVGSYVGVHYLAHPTWRVSTQPHTLRASDVKVKTKLPVGDPTHLPVHAMVQYEWLLVST